MTSVSYSDQMISNVKRSQIGVPAPRTDAPGKIFGTTPFAGDFVMPGMLHACVVRADAASAKLVSLNIEKARELEGVACVLTAEDLPVVETCAEAVGQKQEGPDNASRCWPASGSGITASPLR